VFVGQSYQISSGGGNSVSGTSGADPFSLSRDTDGSHIDWSLGTVTGQVLIADPNGLTLNGLGGSDTLTLDYSHGNPLPGLLRLNGTFSVVGLSGNNPLAGVTLDVNQSTVYFANPSAQIPLSLIRQYINNAYNQGAWTGTATPSAGAITSSAARSAAANTFGIGYADSVTGVVSSQPANTIELRYTLIGDSDLDGTVGAPDAIAMARNYLLPTPAVWTQGDFNYDGVVNMSDALLLQKNFGATMPPAMFAAPAVIPVAAATPVAPAIVTSSTIANPTSSTPTTDDEDGDSLRGPGKALTHRTNKKPPKRFSDRKAR
jgi:hypothetical protein